MTYLICLVGLENRLAVVIGGGKVATCKAQALQQGCLVNVVDSVLWKL